MGIHRYAIIGIISIVILVSVSLSLEFASQTFETTDSEILLFTSDSLRHKKRKIDRQLPLMTPGSNTGQKHNAHDLNSMSARNQFANTLSRTVLEEFRDSFKDGGVSREDFVIKAPKLQNETAEKHN